MVEDCFYLLTDFTIEVESKMTLAHLSVIDLQACIFVPIVRGPKMVCTMANKARLSGIKFQGWVAMHVICCCLILPCPGMDAFSDINQPSFMPCQ